MAKFTNTGKPEDWEETDYHRWEVGLYAACVWPPDMEIPDRVAARDAYYAHNPCPGRDVSGSHLWWTKFTAEDPDDMFHF